MKNANIFRRHDAFFLGSLGLFCLLFIWEAAARLKWMDPVLISSPSLVAVALREWVIHGTFWRDLGTSVFELLVGFGSAALIGVPLGVAMGWKRRVEYALDPFLWTLYAMPVVSLWPLFIIWLGMGMKPIITLAFLFAVVPVTINTMTGVRGVDPILIRCARSFNARSADLFFKFTLPASLPMIIAGLRLGIGRSLIGIIIGELFSSNEGLGFHISYYGARLRFDFVFAGLFVVVLLGLFVTQIIRALEARLARWKA